MIATRKLKELLGDETSTCRKVIKTVFLVSTWICIGLMLEIQGPTFKDLEIQTGASTEDISRAISGRSAGYFIGSIIGGFLVDKFIGYCDLMIAICLDGGAIATAVVPWSPNHVVLWVLFTLQGIFEGVINIAGQKLILLVWQKKASSPLHALHLGFGVGSFIVPNIANPFLAVPAPSFTTNHNASNKNSEYINSSNVTSSFVNDTSGTSTVTSQFDNNTFNTAQSLNESVIQVSTSPVVYIKESNIEIAYIIVAIITGVLSLVFYGYQFFRRNRNGNATVHNSVKRVERKSLRQIIDPGTCAPGDRIFSIKLFILLFFFYFNAVGGERILGKFIRNYSIDQLNFSVDEGSLINTVFWISFSIGRFSGFLAARWIPIRILLPIEALGALISSIFLNVFARDNSTMLWVFIIPVGFFEAPMFPSAMGWADTYLEMTGSAITFLLLGGASGGVAYMFIIGYFYDNYGNFSFLYQVAAFGVIATLLAILLTLVGRGRGNRYDFQNISQNDEDDFDAIEIEKLERCRHNYRDNEDSHQ